MKLSRKRRRELRRLRNEAQELLDNQRVVLGHAGEVLHEAKNQARKLGDEYVAPRIDVAFNAARPTINRGVDFARGAANTVRRTITPAIASALVATIHKLDELEQGDASRQVRGFGERTGILQPQKKKRRAGGVIAIGVGIAAAAGAGYALWQAFRTDDELWVAPEDE